jgi:hypothetical protein
MIIALNLLDTIPAEIDFTSTANHLVAATNFLDPRFALGARFRASADVFLCKLIQEDWKISLVRVKFFVNVFLIDCLKFLKFCHHYTFGFFLINPQCWALFEKVILLLTSQTKLEIALCTDTKILGNI